MSVQELTDALNRFYHTAQFTTLAFQNFADAYRGTGRRPHGSLLARHRRRRHK